MGLAGGRISGTVVAQIGRLFDTGTAAGLPDGELLARFLASGDESAFEAILVRHGPMVLGVLRRLLRDPNDVDDAFQATFVILVRKARGLRRREVLASWLHGVAYRVAMKARTAAARRAALVAAGDAIMGSSSSADGRDSGTRTLEDAELQDLLHAEVNRLPERYRKPIVLCYLEGMTHEQAAARMACPVGTVKGRLSRARDLLSHRLLQRGVALSGAALGGQLALSPAQAAVPHKLEAATLAAAKAVLGGLTAASASILSPTVKSLAQGVLETMFWSKAKLIAVPFVVAAGTAAFAAAEYQAGGAGGAAPQGGFTKHGPAESQKAAAQAIPPGGPAGGMMSRGPGMAGAMSAMMGQRPGGMAGAMGGGGMMAAMEGGGFGPNSEQERIRAQTRKLQLRTSIATQLGYLEARTRNPRDRAIWKTLDTPIAMSFANETPLGDVLKYLKQATTAKQSDGLPIYVDPQGLQDAEVSMNSTVAIDLEGVPLKTTLRLLLKQLNLAYCVRDGILIISSMEGVQGELSEARAEEDGRLEAAEDEGTPVAQEPSPRSSSPRSPRAGAAPRRRPVEEEAEPTEVVPAPGRQRVEGEAPPTEVVPAPGEKQPTNPQ